MTTHTHRLKSLVENIVEELLACAVANTTTHIVLLQFIESLVFGPELGKVVGCAECLKVCEYGIALKIAGLVHTHTRCSVRHLLHLLPYIGSRIAEVDTVAERLRHLLLAVGSGQTTCCSILRKHDFRLNKHLAVCLVEAANKLACHLNHRLLVFAGRHCSGLEQRDVGSLAYGIAEETKWNVGLKVAHLNLGLHCRVALYA